MPEDITVTLYEIDELEEEAKEKALDQCRDWNTDNSFWYEDLIDTGEPVEEYSFKFKAREAGFEMHQFYFSGFWSQGDGASFEADVDYEDYILKNKLGNRYRTLLNHVRRDGSAGLTIKTRGHYSHANTMYIEQADHYFNAADDSTRAWHASNKADHQADELIEVILDHGRDLAHDFYRQLEEEYEYLSSDEQIEESLKDNGVKFTEDGSLY